MAPIRTLEDRELRMICCCIICPGTASTVTAFGPHAATLQDDIANYTDVAPVFQFNEMKISR
jgi:hypothetical protein